MLLLEECVGRVVSLKLVPIGITGVTNTSVEWIFACQTGGFTPNRPKPNASATRNYALCLSEASPLPIDNHHRPYYMSQLIESNTDLPKGTH